MTPTLKTGLLAAGVAIVGSTAIATAGTPSRDAEEAGLCTDDLGCKSGQVKCADGTLTTPGGLEVKFTCYTTLNQT